MLQARQSRLAPDDQSLMISHARVYLQHHLSFGSVARRKIDIEKNEQTKRGVDNMLASPRSRNVSEWPPDLTVLIKILGKISMLMLYLCITLALKIYSSPSTTTVWSP